MRYNIWHNPEAEPHTTLAIADGGIVLANPLPNELARARRAVEERRSPAGRLGDGALLVSTGNLFRLLAEPGSSRLGLSYRHRGVKIGAFNFAEPQERDRAVEVLEKELGLRRSTREGPGGWNQAVKPALYLLAVVMITLGLAGALSDAATGSTAGKMRLIVILADVLGPTAVLVVGSIVSAAFLLRMIAKLRLPGPSTILMPVMA